MFLKTWCIFSLIGFLKGSTPPSNQGCYTQIPGRGKDNRVMSCRDKYAVIPDSFFCMGNVQQKRLSDIETEEIVTKHNEIRSMVSPKAADMVPLKYNKGLERTAHIWAELCKLQPSKFLQRFRPGSYDLGENVYVGQKVMNWSAVIDEWAQEKSSFTFGHRKNNLSLVSNYTQLVWAKSSAVGCSKANCSGQFFYVCQYAPAMNNSNIDTPYESSNQSCSKCQNCNNTLCDCKGILCLNGGTLNFQTCDCDCITEVHSYEANTCELKCKPGGDDTNCGTIYKLSTCRTSVETMYHCPWLCDLCPYAGKDYADKTEPLPWERNRTECPYPTTTSKTTSRQGTQAGTRSSQSTKMSVQQIILPVQSTETTNKHDTSSGSQSAQMNDRQCGNGSPCTGSPQWTVVVVFMLTFFYIRK